MGNSRKWTPKIGVRMKTALADLGVRMMGVRMKMNTGGPHRHVRVGSDAPEVPLELKFGPVTDLDMRRRLNVVELIRHKGVIPW